MYLIKIDDYKIYLVHFQVIVSYEKQVRIIEIWIMSNKHYLTNYRAGMYVHIRYISTYNVHIASLP